MNGGFPPTPTLLFAFYHLTPAEISPSSTVQTGSYTESCVGGRTVGQALRCKTLLGLRQQLCKGLLLRMILALRFRMWNPVFCFFSVRPCFHRSSSAQFFQRRVRDILRLCENVCSVVTFSDPAIASHLILLLHRSVLHSKDGFRWLEYFVVVCGTYCLSHH